LYEIYGNFYDFVRAIPLNDGHYQDAAVTVSNPNLRVVGQKDLVHQRAHLWIQNRRHTWRNVVDGVFVPPVSGTVTLGGFQRDQDYIVQWWDTYGTGIVRTERITSQSDGDILLVVGNLAKDIALKVSRSVAASVYLPLIIKNG
jgi:hypothetical protein